MPRGLSLEARPAARQWILTGQQNQVSNDQKDTEIHGEDIGVPDEQLAHRRIITNMEFVGNRLAAYDTSDAVLRRQADILRQLASLIERTKASDDNERTSEKGGTNGFLQEDRSSANDSKGGDSPATDSAPAARADGTSQAADYWVKQMTREKVWGHLPPQMRDSLMNVPANGFHPKYRDLIQSYYRRMAIVTDPDQ